MSIIVTAVATDSGVPIFSRKRGTIDNVQFSTIASLHGVNMFSKCHNVSINNTQVDNGTILWKEYCKSITLIGVVTGGLECDLELLLQNVYNAMTFFIGKKDLEAMKNVEQIKRDLRQSYSILDYLLESLDNSSVPSSHPTMFLDLIECLLCPQSQQLQLALDNYAQSVGGRWACLCVSGRLAACSSDVRDLDSRDTRLLLLLAAQAGAPLRETPVYLPYASPDVAFRAITCKLLADVYILVVCGATPPLSEIDEIILQCWEGYAQMIKEVKTLYPRNIPASIQFEPCVLGILLVNISNHKCVFSRHLHTNQKSRSTSGTHCMDILRTFYIRTARDVAPQLKFDKDETEQLSDMCEAYWCSEYHKCHAQRSENLLCCVLYASNIPTHTIRLITGQIIQSFNNSKEICW